MEAVRASKPCDFLYGVVVDDGTLVPDGVIRLKLSDKLEIDDKFLVWGRNVSRENIEIGDRLILLQKAGGQLFYVMDKLR